MQADNIVASVGETVEYGRLYFQQEKDILKVEVAETLANTTSKLISMAVIAIFSLLAFVFLSVTMGIFLGQLLGNYGLAFLIVSSVYLLLALAIYFFRDDVVNGPVHTLIANEILGDKYEDKEHLKMTSEITRHELANSIGTNRSELKDYLLKRVGLPLGVAGAAFGGMKLFSNNSSKTATGNSALLMKLLPTIFSLVSTYFIKETAEEISEEATKSKGTSSPTNLYEVA